MTLPSSVSPGAAGLLRNNTALLGRERVARERMGEDETRQQGGEKLSIMSVSPLRKREGSDKIPTCLERGGSK